ncbi:MAG: glycosyltransferase family 39 protein [Candidatus Omnitrophota bacterium]
MKRECGRKESWILMLILTLLVASLIRVSAFYLPHDNGDQVFFLGTAMKLDKFGIEGYNFRKIDTRSDGRILGLFHSEGEGKGALLEGLATAGIYYYDEPLYHVPPLFSYMLMFSHRLFAKEKPYLAVTANLISGPKVKRPMDFVNIQFYCSVVPFFFSLLFISSVFLMGRTLFSDRVGFYAALLISISPIDILSSQKVWADDMVSFFLVLGALLFLMGHKKDRVILSAMGGACGGLATLGKQNGAFIVIALILFSLWQRRSELLSRHFLKAIFDKHLVAFGIAMFLITLPWFYMMTTTYGVPWYHPSQPGLGQTEWFKTIAERPWYTYLVGIPYLVPLFIFGYLRICSAFRRSESRRPESAFLILWFLVYFSIMSFYFRSMEHRYMLPAYAPLAICSALAMEGFAEYLNKRLGRSYGFTVVLLLIIACAAWSVPIGISHAFGNVGLILEPF